jgi:hypothetical protein
MDRLLALRTFARVVELGSFARQGIRCSCRKRLSAIWCRPGNASACLVPRTTRRVTVTPDSAAF